MKETGKNLHASVTLPALDDLRTLRFELPMGCHAGEAFLKPRTELGETVSHGDGLGGLFG
jgi:hypothetical protein